MFLAFAWRYPAEGLGAWLWAEGASRCLNFKAAAADALAIIESASVRCRIALGPIARRKTLRPQVPGAVATPMDSATPLAANRDGFSLGAAGAVDAEATVVACEALGGARFRIALGRTRPTPVPGFGEGAARFASFPPKRSGSRSRVAGSECSPTRRGHLALNRRRVA